MSRTRTTPPARRRPNPVLLAGIVSLSVTLLAGWWFVLRPPERSAEALCSHLGQVAELDERLATSPADIADDVAGLRAAAAAAPPEVASDVEALAVAVITVAEETRARPDDPSGGLRAGMARLEPSADDLESASTRVVAWAEEHCGLRLEAETAAAADAGAVRASRPDGR